MFVSNTYILRLSASEHSYSYHIKSIGLPWTFYFACLLAT